MRWVSVKSLSSTTSDQEKSVCLRECICPKMLNWLEVLITVRVKIHNIRKNSDVSQNFYSSKSNFRGPIHEGLNVGRNFVLVFEYTASKASLIISILKLNLALSRQKNLHFID